MVSEEEIFENKKTDRIYYSPKFKNPDPNKDNWDVRYVDKAFVVDELHEFFKENDQLIIRTTPNQKQQLVAKLYENSRGIYALTIQRYTTKTGQPHKYTNITLSSKEIVLLLDFLETVKIIPFEGVGAGKYDDSKIEGFKRVIKENPLAIKELIIDNPDILQEVLEKHITKSDIIALAFRKEQLKMFHKLLNDKNYFDSQKEIWKKTKDEDVWQHFFEINKWIFGYGLNYFFNDSLDEKKLEQTISGFNFNQRGKRIDALLKTKGIINSICLGEIKLHYTKLLKPVSKAYRPESWAISDELAGGVAQVQRSTQKLIETFGSKIEIKDNEGYLTGEELYIYNPKSFLIIGNLSEFSGEKGINKDKYSSFEMFRKNIINPEILTFDELYERAKYIVEGYDYTESLKNKDNQINKIDFLQDTNDLPF